MKLFKLNSKNIQDGRAALHEVCRSPANKKEEVLARIAKRLIQSGCDVNLTSASQVNNYSLTNV